MRYEEALRIAEARDRELREKFHRFDIDGSGTIEMEELLALMDDMGLLANLKCEPVDFAAEMFHKYDANQDGVLSFEEFKRFHNAAKDNAAGRQTRPRNSAASRTNSGLDPKLLEARKAAALESARNKALEADRIRKENAALKARIMAQAKAGGRDAKSLDAEYEAKRRELAEKRAREKAELQANLAKQNAAMKERIASVAGATITHLSAEHEAKRLELEKANLLRQQTAAAETIQRAHALKKKVSSVSAVTVNQLSMAEEEARAEVARKAAEARAAELARKEELNRSYRVKLDSVGAATVASLSAEEEAARAAQAAETAARKKAQDDALAARNRENAARIAATGSATLYG
uniref:EF-hand domain-containing protein n=1 Tax=Haptolina brevifila TaxID=156173 RepID=A0A7S2N9P3_9EUKA|mmetsp:Transcript_71141/g.141051  ORF Transcript_71141/g.141051 Transcript_71141/m.141051 type:complete len:351 (+) Transcript_71141:82-1134(+)